MNTISIDNVSGVVQFGRDAFARRLLNVVCRVDADESGAVIGLEGRWGSGKTHVLRSLETEADAMDGQSRPLLVHFNPWMVSGAHDIVTALLLQLAAAASASDGASTKQPGVAGGLRAGASKGANVSGAILRYASMLSVLKDAAWVSDLVLPGSSVVVAGIGHAADKLVSPSRTFSKSLREIAGDPSKLSLHETRTRVIEELRSQPRRIVVLVDDLDRLPPEELGEMIRAVKAVADFPKVVYLLSYDPGIVSTALETALGVTDGRAYLEKIVHLPVVLPTVPAGTFHAFAIARLRDAVSDLNLSPLEARDLEDAFRLAAAMLATPRDVERLRTRMMYLGEILLAQVNLADVLILEAAAMCVPGVVQWITRNVEILTEGYSAQYHRDLLARGIFQTEELAEIRRGKATDEQLREVLGRWKKHVPEQRRSEQDAIGRALRFVFDELVPGHGKADRSNYRRGQDFTYLYRWQCGAQSHDLFSTAEIEDLLREPASLRKRAFNDESTFRDFCRHLLDLHEDSIAPVDVQALAVAFADAEKKFGSDVVANLGEVFGPFRTLEKYLDRADAGTLIGSLNTLVDRGTVWLSGGALRHQWIREASARTDGVHGRVTQEELRPIVDAWLVNVEATIRERPWAPPRPEYSVHSLLTLAWHMDCDAGALQKLLIAALFEQELGLVACFGDFRGEPVHGRWDIDSPILPPAKDLLPLVSFDQDFANTHQAFVIALQARAEHESAAPEAAGSPSEGATPPN